MPFAASQTLRIALVTPFFRSAQEPDSGIGNHVYDLAWALTAQGQDVTVIYITGAPAPLAQIETGAGRGHFHVVQLGVKSPGWIKHAGRRAWILEQIWYELGRIAVCYRWFSRLAAPERPDVIETSSFGALCLGLTFRRSTPAIAVRVSTTMEQIMGDYFPLSSRLLRRLARLENLFISRSRHLVTHTAAHRDQICAALQLSPGKFTLIPHGIEMPPDADLEKPSESDATVTILYVGRFEFRKGTDVLLDALPVVLRASSQVRVVLIGRDSAGQFEERFGKEHRHTLGHRVRALGSVSQADLREHYRHCDIFVAPSRYESFGLIYVEAMAWGKPVVGCRTGGVPEVIRENETGLLAAPGNVADLAAKLIQLTCDPALRKRLGAAGRLDAVERFSREAMAKRSIVYYRSL